jgi:hypothetical protein
VLKTLTRAIGAKAWEPIPVAELAAALLRVAEQREPLNATLEGAALWEVVASARAAA